MPTLGALSQAEFLNLGKAINAMAVNSPKVPEPVKADIREHGVFSD
ncbi:MAG: hypothetical protein OXI41_06780 [Chloroflexota bacterium]|nr:hypothetical protein [Chloroflexota bacterium]MDE2894378.1 hypothetical protein [Chloroflexota bacterium]